MSPNLLSSWATSIGRDGSDFRLERFSFSWKRRTVLTFCFHAFPAKSLCALPGKSTSHFSRNCFRC
ncbi:hypothetical protein GFL80_02000 [Rhizobium leguminosarum bv. viciae]|nr:hypothetical protein [Rhizobium leguminosarum bv. viciae]NKK83076.1 hypothetical protein [Rhizobium leguminosarum bv. viciae]